MQEDPMMSGHLDKPLSGVRVLEFGEFAAGPFCGMLLADWGADVVKVESPQGDRLRNWPPFLTSDDGSTLSANFVALNRNKRSMSLDLRDSEARDTAADLCGAADIVVENYRPGVMTRLGLGYAAVADRNRQVVYCSISGYGQTGPYATRGAFDIAIQAISGVMSVTGDGDRPPAKCGVAVADFLAGAYGAASVLAALRAATLTGTGTHIDCSMLSCMLSIATIQTSEYWGSGEPPKRMGSRHPQNAPYQAFEASDGYFVVAAGTQGLWEDLCDIVGLEELKADARFGTQADRVTHQLALEQLLVPRFATATVAEWLDVLSAADIPCSPVYDYAEVLADPHVQQSGLLTLVELPGGGTANAMSSAVRMSGFDFTNLEPPPRLGGAANDVVAEWTSGLS
jgi:crotonobetainyl-CoA:carnitine CoA-transferase CaiB-like acyl-CoA transferase